jgi:hypothetical protein
LHALNITDTENIATKIKQIIKTPTREQQPLKRKRKEYHTITEADVIHTRTLLQGYIISELDKNTGQLYASCPKIEEARIIKEVEQCENFEHREGLTSKYILEGIYTRYKELKLDKIERWANGSIPYVYPNPKHKAPKIKTRIIASYFNFPLKKLYKLASKAGTWLLRKLPPTYKHFTLHNMGNLKNRLTTGLEKIKKIYGANTEIFSFGTDVKQMYTFL